ncbi:MAG: hypothetical protein OWT27_09090 [Firmicutes bacterium]|nr:hypothetical protein [Bacillota bacterium]
MLMKSASLISVPKNGYLATRPFRKNRTKQGQIEDALVLECVPRIFSRQALCDFVEWAKMLPLWLEIDTALFVHAGMRTGVSMQEQTAENLLWLRTFSTIGMEARPPRALFGSRATRLRGSNQP